MKNRINTALVIGATSDIGRAIAFKLAEYGYMMQLASRNPVHLEQEKQNIWKNTNANVTLHKCDVQQNDYGLSLIDELDPLPDIAVCVIGYLGDNNGSASNSTVAERLIRVNFLGPTLLMGALADQFEKRGSGVLVGVSSVAGDRGRATNCLYGSAKAGFTAFLSGLRNRLTFSGVHVVTVKPGYVRTRMTNGLDLPAWLTATPEEVAEAVIKAIHQRRDIIYVRRIWSFLMLIICVLPERIFKRIKL